MPTFIVKKLEYLENMCLFYCHKVFAIMAPVLSQGLTNSSTNDVLSANKHDILEAYPPLKDCELSEKLMNACLQ